MNVKNGDIIVIPTDTLYGICTSAFSKKGVENIYKIKGRNEKKPFIILISHLSDIKKFGISGELLNANERLLAKVWPGKVSVILPLADENLAKYAYLHRGTGKLAFRVPRKKALLELLAKTGPLVAPSANPEGMKPAENIREAELYFGSKVKTYMAGGKLAGAPSTIIEIANGGSVKLVRQGAVKVKF